MIRLAIRVAEPYAEQVLAELLELAPAGVEEVHGEHGTPAAGTIEYAVYGAPGELPELPELRALAGQALVQVATAEIADDWHERWRQFHRPVTIPAPAPLIGERPAVPALRVRPPWEAAAQHADEQLLEEIVIDPAQAFGTGAHASTRLCLELLLELAATNPARARVLDIGTGSGVLAIAAAKLGYQPVLALDNERESVRAARANARVNHTGTIDVRRLDLRTQQLPSIDGAALVLANLLRPLLLELAAKLAAPPAHLIAGGLLTHEADELAEAFASQLGLREHSRREQGEWAALWLSRDPGSR